MAEESEPDAKVDLAKMREDLDNAKAANAFLCRAIEELGSMMFHMQYMAIAKMTNGDASEADKAAFSDMAQRLDEMLKGAAERIWDEDGKPR